MNHQTIDGITYTDHALARMASRGIPASVVGYLLRVATPRRERDNRWAYRVSGDLANHPVLRRWAGVCAMWCGDARVVVTVFWEEPRPLARRHKVYVRRGPKRGWVYLPTTKAGGRA